MDELWRIKFPRSITPKSQFKNPTLLVFSDRSGEVCCFLVYLRWERDDDHMECRVVTGKT
jgi:hypothetical protein